MSFVIRHKPPCMPSRIDANGGPLIASGREGAANWKEGWAYKAPLSLTSVRGERLEMEFRTFRELPGQEGRLVSSLPLSPHSLLRLTSGVVSVENAGKPSDSLG